jgi:hypothetical protein
MIDEIQASDGRFLVARDAIAVDGEGARDRSNIACLHNN